MCVMECVVQVPDVKVPDIKVPDIKVPDIKAESDRLHEITKPT